MHSTARYLPSLIKIQISASTDYAASLLNINIAPEADARYIYDP